MAATEQAPCGCGRSLGFARSVRRYCGRDGYWCSTCRAALEAWGRKVGAR